MTIYIVRASAHRPGDVDSTDRHYPIHAETPEAALEAVKAMKPHPHPVHPGVLCGHMPGSTFAVIDAARF